MCKTEKARIAEELLGYLARHPEAQDTLEGISEWWLLEEKIRRRTAEIKEVLTELVGSGLVVEHLGQDARTRYRINRRRYEQRAAPTQPEAVAECGADGPGLDGVR